MEQEIKFEKAMERLERIVEDLESGNMPLEDALKKYEEGVNLSRTCTKKIEQAETKIEVLTRTLNETASSDELGSGTNKKKSNRKKGKRDQATGEVSDDDLLI
jgi:exodeoxyribonuclease VII small subunit